MRPRTVFFDFGGTLAEPIAEPLDVWVDVANDLGLGADRPAMDRALATANEWFATAVFEHHGRTPELWRRYETRVLDALRIEDVDGSLASAIEGRFRRVQWNRLYPESRSVLETLRGHGYALGVISNATEEVLDRLRDMDVMGYFDSITYSQEAGANKPDPAIFRLALRRAGCGPEESMHIGNTYDDDVVGARGVGIAPVLVDRDDGQRDADCPRVRDLTGVLELLP